MSDVLHSFPSPIETVDGSTQEPPIVLHRLSVDQYHAMIQTGVLAEDDRIELLDGWLVSMSPQGVAHVYCVKALSKWLTKLIPEGYDVDAQFPITLTTSEPEPDIFLVRGKMEDFRTRHPGPQDISLIIEVADSSITKDRRVKSRLYAEAGIPEYWIVNLSARSATIFRQPQPAAADLPGSYLQAIEVPADGSLTLSLDGKQLGEFSLASIWPKA